MPRKAIDLVGVRFGKLVVLMRDGSDARNALWRVRCDCGNERTFSATRIKSRMTASCGCLGNAKTNLIHGMSKSPVYRRWLAIRSRCHSPNDAAYRRYGAKGISVCDEWRNSFPAFREWAEANGFRADYDIDRIDPTKGYGPSNCRFITPRENRQITRRAKRVLFGGVPMSYAEASRISGVARGEIRKRIERGYTPDEAWRPEPKNPKYSVCQKPRRD